MVAVTAVVPVGMVGVTTVVPVGVSVTAVLAVGGARVLVGAAVSIGAVVLHGVRVVWVVSRGLVLAAGTTVLVCDGYPVVVVAAHGRPSRVARRPPCMDTPRGYRKERLVDLVYSVARPQDPRRQVADMYPPWPVAYGVP